MPINIIIDYYEKIVNIESRVLVNNQDVYHLKYHLNLNYTNRIVTIIHKKKKWLTFSFNSLFIFPYWSSIKKVYFWMYIQI